MKLDKLQYIERKKGLINNERTEKLCTFKNFPVFIGSTNQDPNLDLFHDMTLNICKKTGFIQTKDLINSNIIYSGFHSESIGETWDKHRDIFSDLIIKYTKNKSKILEIGGSDARLANILLKKNENIEKITIVEPNINNNKNNNIKINYIEEFFEECKDIYLGYDIVVHSHVFEHSSNPKKFIENISNILEYEKYHIFAVPNLYSYIKNKYINVLNFEHTFYLSENFIDYILSLYDFNIIEKYYYLNHGIYYVVKKQKVVPNHLPNDYTQNKKIFLEHINYYKKYVKYLNNELKKLNNQKDVYLFGAHVFSQFLIVLGLNTEKMKGILDNSKIKHNTRLYGTNLKINLPDTVNLNENSVILLNVGQYQEEIKTKLKKINKNINIIE